MKLRNHQGFVTAVRDKLYSVRGTRRFLRQRWTAAAMLIGETAEQIEGEVTAEKITEKLTAGKRRWEEAFFELCLKLLPYVLPILVQFLVVVVL